MKKGTLMRITAIFFAAMLCFTILSRAADQMSIAVVQTERPQNRMIEHTVRTVGRVVQNRELAVTTLADQRVTAIYVREGERVAKGDLLFEIDLGLLREKILNQEQEMEKQELQTQDAASRISVSAMQKAEQQARAGEQYALSTGRAGMQLSRAKKQLAQAKKELEDFRAQNGVTTENSQVEDELLRTLEEKTDACVAAQQELTSLEWEIENAVHIALQNAKSGASLVREQSVFMQSAQEAGPIADFDTDFEILGIEVENPGMDGAQNNAVVQSEIPSVQPDTPSAQSQTGASSAQPEIPSVEPETPSTQPETPSVQSETPSTQPETPSAQPDVILPPSGTGEPQQQGPTQAELDAVEQSVRDGYAAQLAAARQKVQTAKQEKEAAESALMQYRQELLTAADAQNAQTAEQLLANVQAAQQAYEDAAFAANEAAVTSGREVEMAGIPDASDSSARTGEITHEQMELTLEKLKKLESDNGQIRAETDGLITGISIMTGEKTSDTTAILMADLAEGYRFTADLTKDQQEYIGTGDAVRLTSGDGKTSFEDLPVESVTADEETEDLYHITVQLPKDSFEIGANVTLNFSRKSQAYPVTVPLSALHLDEKRQAYVLVTEEFSSVMGTETRARRVSVSVEEQNESYAALKQGALDSRQEIIVSSDKAVDEGSRVRVGEQTGTG